MAIDQPSRCGDFFVTSFGPPVRTVQQALQQLVRFEANLGARLTMDQNRLVKVGNLNGVLVSGRLAFQDGNSMKWEGVFVATQAGVRGVAFFGQNQAWNQLAAHRKTIFGSFRVVR